MEEKGINLPVFSLSIKQSAKGNYYAEGIKVRADSADDAEMFLQDAVKIVKKQVEELNKH